MSIPAPVRAALYERSHGCCEACGKVGANNAHHRKNQSQGGPDTLGNLMLLCGSGTTGCHGIITVHPQRALQLGFTVPRWVDDPSTVPVWRWSRELGQPLRVVLGDDGGVNPALPDPPPYRIEDTCCGQCPGNSCYVDQVTGA